MSTGPHILVVEDDDCVAEMLLDHLRATAGAEPVRARSAAEAARLHGLRRPDLMLVDLLLPDGSGLDLIRRLRCGRSCAVVVVTGHPTLGRAVEALRLGVADLLVKPFDLQRLSIVVRNGLAGQAERQRQRVRSDRLRRLVRKTLAERRQLQQRIDLVCGDLVGAYRELARRVVRLDRRAQPPGGGPRSGARA